ncbi:MAG: hypothetical protein JO269_04885 [Burkholderiaceae bacterium]|nr:hypothetical protein [Burkholderiaceae bacterium]
MSENEAEKILQRHEEAAAQQLAQPPSPHFVLRQPPKGRLPLGANRIDPEGDAGEGIAVLGYN